MCSLSYVCHRYALNYKGLPLKTEWIEYPDIADLYPKLGIKATAQKGGKPYYTLPVIHDPNTGSTISESAAIVKYLDKTYPQTPVLFPKGTDAFQAIFVRWCGVEVSNNVHDVVVAAVWKILPERSQVFFRTTREANHGKKLEDILGEEEWRATEEGFRRLDKFLAVNGAGADELVMGDQVCFADIQIASILVWAKRSLGEDSEAWKRICSWNGGKWKRIADRFAKYEIVDI